MRTHTHTHLHAPLPPGWQSAIDPTSGVVYYCNPSASITQWDHPGAGPSVTSCADWAWYSAQSQAEQQALASAPSALVVTSERDEQLDDGSVSSRRAGPADDEQQLKRKRRKATAERSTSSLELCSAAERGDVAVVRQALLEGVPVNTVGPDGKTALHLACYQGHTSVAKELLTSGASIDLLDGAGFAPLHYACMRGQKKVALLLIDKGANPTLPTAAGKVPISLVGPEHALIRKQITAAATARHTGCLIGKHVYGKAPGL